MDLLPALAVPPGQRGGGRRGAGEVVGSSPQTGDPVTASQPTSGVGKARSTACRESDRRKAVGRGLARNGGR
jgi:hypothetical protein